MATTLQINGEDRTITLASSLTDTSHQEVPTSKAVADYIEGLGLEDAEVFRGAIDCSTNPNYPAANAGDIYRVSVAGKIGGGSGATVEAGDRLECTADATASGNHATVGTYWMITQGNLTIDTDGALAANSDAIVASQKAVKTYADTKMANSVADANCILGAVTDNTPAAIAMAASRIAGRKATGDVCAMTLSEVLDLVGSAADGDILFRSGGAWARLPKGSDGDTLKLVSGLPAWVTPA